MYKEDFSSGANSGLQAADFIMASHPIFSRDMNVFAHELLFRQCHGDECAVITNFDDATNKIIADGFSLASSRLGNKGVLSVNVGYENIMSKSVQALPPSRVILEVPGDIQVSPEFLATCLELKASGYCFLVDNYSADNPGVNKLVELADYLKVPVDEVDGQAVARIRKSLSGWNGKLIASRVENWEAFEGCKFLGFDYFQGYFFTYPKDLTGKKISSHKVARLNLIRLLSDEDIDLSQIVDVIATDQALSVRLLQFVNSAAFSLGNRVDTLGRAAAMVGVNTIRKWAMAAALSDMDSTDRGVELCCRTLQGAIFLGKLAEQHPQISQDRETLYLMGLLHNVDSLMSMKMKEVLDTMPLKAVVRQALLRDPKEPLTRFLSLLDAIWRNEWNRARSFLNAAGIPLSKAAPLFMQAGEETGELITALAGSVEQGRPKGCDFPVNATSKAI